MTKLKAGRFSKKEIFKLITFIENGGKKVPFKVIAKQMNRSEEAIKKILRDYQKDPQSIVHPIYKSLRDKNNQKPDKSTPKNNHKHRQSIINANGKPFSYSATLLFWGSMIALTAFNAFFLWSTRGN